jgi:hypothetical protein
MGTTTTVRIIVIDLEACSTVTDLTRMGRSHSKAAMRDYEPQSDAATWRMLASATGMAAAFIFWAHVRRDYCFRSQNLVGVLVTRDVETLCGILGDLVPQRLH